MVSSSARTSSSPVPDVYPDISSPSYQDKVPVMSGVLQEVFGTIPEAEPLPSLDELCSEPSKPSPRILRKLETFTESTNGYSEEDEDDVWARAESFTVDKMWATLPNSAKSSLTNTLPNSYTKRKSDGYVSKEPKPRSRKSLVEFSTSEQNEKAPLTISGPVHSSEPYNWKKRRERSLRTTVKKNRRKSSNSDALCIPELSYTYEVSEPLSSAYH